MSTGIGTDNIDIVVNELDALVNIDLEKRLPKSEHKSLNLVRLGTSGGLQKEIPVGSFLLTATSIGFDGLLNFYANRDKFCNTDFTEFQRSNKNPPFCHCHQRNYFHQKECLYDRSGQHGCRAHRRAADHRTRSIDHFIVADQ